MVGELLGHDHALCVETEGKLVQLFEEEKKDSSENHMVALPPSYPFSLLTNGTLGPVLYVT